MAIAPLSGGDLRVAMGLAANSVAASLVAMLWSKKILTDDEPLTVITSAIEELRLLSAAQPHPTWGAAQNLLKMQASRFGGPAPGAKPS
jgi:hypothetical protein